MRADVFLVAVLSFIVVMVTPVFAEQVTNNNPTRAQIEKLSSQTKALQSQINYLQREMKSLKKQQSSVPSASIESKKQATASTSSNNDDANVAPVLSQQDLSKLVNEEVQYLPFDMEVPGQAFVSTGPYVGVPIQYAGSDLVINSPSVNTDLQILVIRKSIYEQLLMMGGMIRKEPYRSHLLFSGAIEARANYINIGGAPSTSNIDLPNVSLDAFILGPSNWILGFIEFSYDNARPSDSFYTVANSRLFVNKAFITLGNLSDSPYYGTAGRYYVPFGAYSSLMISDVLTKLMMRTKANALTFGVKEPGDNAFFGSLYVFKGDSHAAYVSKINNGGVNLGYHYRKGIFHGNFGAGMIGNIADSGGFQTSNGFSQYEQITHRVPGYDVRGVFALGEHIDFIGEFVGSTTAFNPNDMSFNGQGAKPWALDTELAYTFSIFDNKPSTIAIGYQKTNQALSLGLPLNRYSLVLNTALWRNTLESIELRHDQNYAASDTANGPSGAATTTGECTSAKCTASGKYDNAVTVQFDYFF